MTWHDWTVLIQILTVIVLAVTIVVQIATLRRMRKRR